jgi:hypothetical protein
VTHRSLVGIATLIALGTACEDSFTSEDDQIKYIASEMRVGRQRLFTNDTPVLEGSRICVDCTAVPSDEFDVSLLSCGDDYENSDILTCFTRTDFQGYTDDDGCFVAQGPDEAGWFYFPKSCTVTDFWGFLPRKDATLFRVAERDDVSASFEQWPENYAEQLVSLGYMVKNTGGGFGDDWKTDPVLPFRILAGQEYALSIQLTSDITGEQVAFNTFGLRIDVVTEAGPAPVWRDGDVAGTIVINPYIGTVARVFITIENKWTYDAGVIMGVAPGAIDNLEVVVAHEDTPKTDGWGPPVAARAIARDVAGNIIHGTPVEWEVTRGRLSVGGDAVLFPSTEYVNLADSCWKADQETVIRSAVLKATAMDLEADAELLWTPYIDEDYVVDVSLCEQGCNGGCATGTAESTAFVGATVMAAMLLRRRRSR